MKKSTSFLTISAACLLGFAVGHLSTSSPAGADVRQTTPRVAFESGSERSLATLDLIARHLKSIDDRVARIERAVATKPGRDANRQPLPNRE